jgi:hypothetical protein
MSRESQVKMQAKTSASVATMKIVEPTLTISKHRAEKPALAVQLQSASRLGHSLGAIRVDRSAASAIQRREAREEEDEKPLQGKPVDGANAALQKKEEMRPNLTGLPDQLKAGVENLSGLSLDDVRVHYNSPKPAEVQALAYARGTEIHIAPGQERHLPHEAWHVIQQAQGRVPPTMQAKNAVPVNDDAVLEHEADVIGEKAMQVTKRQNGGLVPKAPWQLKSNSPTIQCYRHALMGTMIHHAQPKEIPGEIDQVNAQFYRRNEVLDSRRGEIKEHPGETYEWDFENLLQKISSMRKQTPLQPGMFPIVINANTMIAPGINKGPKIYTNAKEEVYAFSSVWGFNFKNPDGKSSTYDDALGKWKAVPDQRLSTRGNTVLLGDRAKSLLWTHARDKVRESPNDAIPHRGLRNSFFQNALFMDELQNIEKKADFVHIITLDSDTNLGSGEVLAEIAELAEKYITSENALHVTATDYIYEREDLFEWLAGALDKVGRKKMEQLGFDAYPAEPGLTISYSSRSSEPARRFLAAEPFGPEYSGDHRGSKFREIVDSSQSVEGKNLRARWRLAFSKQRQPIHRTVSYLNVQESDKQKVGHGPTKTKIDASYEKKERISADLVQALISSDNYHSLTPDRNDLEKRSIQKRIVSEATDILNALLVEQKFPENRNALKDQLITKLTTYMTNI